MSIHRETTNPHDMGGVVMAGTGADAARAASAEIELRNHRVVRDGSVWTCMGGCGRTWPWPAPLPEPVGECAPRRWGDQAAS